MTTNFKTEWFAQCGWGVFCHYLGKDDRNRDGAQSAAEWNAQVEVFDVEGLRRQLVSVGAPYFFLTIGQNSGHYCAPNATYDRLVDIQPSKCSCRDLISDVADALHEEGIPLLVYFNSHAPSREPQAIERLKCTPHGDWERMARAWSMKPGSYTPCTDIDSRLREFQYMWQSVICEWSTRWGSKVRGWWIDGCYFADEMFRHKDEPNFQSFAAAMRSGNSDAIVAFNPGVKTPIICHSEHEDYTAGEISRELPECPGPWVERNGYKARYHILSYLGENWCKGLPRFPDEMVCGYTRHVADKGGVITWDVPIQENGLIPEAFINQLKSVGQYMRNHRKNPSNKPDAGDGK